MGASGDGHHKKAAEFGIGRAATGSTIVLLEVVPDLLDSCKVSNSSLDQGRDVQSDVPKHFFVILIPGLIFISRARGTKNKPLALGPKVGLHSSMPLLPVGAGEDWDHLVKSPGHSDIPVV